MSTHSAYPLPARLSQLTSGLEVTCVGADGAEMVTGCAGIAHLEAGKLGYISNPDYLVSAKLPKGSFCITNAVVFAAHEEAFEGVHLILCDNPRRVYAKIAQQLYPPVGANGTIHPTAYIDPSAIIDESAEIGPYCVIGKDVTISAHTILATHVEIGDNVTIGKHCHLASGVKISHTTMGDHVNIAENTVIGKRGFGFEGVGRNVEIIPHLGTVNIGSHVDIGALCAIDRGVDAATSIEHYVMLDNMVHLAHNVSVGEGSILCAQTAIAGSSHIGKSCLFGGKVGVSDHLNIGDNTIVMGNANVTKSLDGGQAYAGFPAVPAQEFWKQQARLRMLVKSKQTKQKN